MTKTRSISDHEVRLIRALINLGMRNKDIQFLFNRPDRPVNSGRISQIKNGTYAPDAGEATKEEAEAFLASAQPQQDVGVRGNTSPIAEEVIVALFRRNGSVITLMSGETDRHECKESFNCKPLDRFVPVLKTIAGLANNKGGYIFFGVKDASAEFVGLADNRFKETDVSEISEKISGCLDPAPTFDIKHMGIDNKTLGVIYVQESSDKPVVTTKSMPGFVEGGIYFRYFGETRLARPGDVRRMVQERERKAVQEFANKIAMTASGSAAFINLDTGLVEGKTGRFVVDESLLPMMQFIREGEFNEQKGLPTLKLLGDVQIGKTKIEYQDRIVRDAITDEAMLLNFLNREQIAHPDQYIKHACYTARRWLPLFYYASLSGRPLQEIITEVAKSQSPRTRSKEDAKSRLQLRRSAFQSAEGQAARDWREKLLAGTAAPPNDIREAGQLARAIIGLESSPPDFEDASELLLACYELTKSRSSGAETLRTMIYKAACRLDELEFTPSPRAS